MGLTKEVRDFFTGRINRLLNGKLTEINDRIDRKQVRKEALELAFVKAGIPSNVVTRYTKILEEEEALEQEERELRSMIYSKIQKAFPKSGVQSYRDDVLGEVGSFAAREFEGKILTDRYPEEMEEIDKIKLVMEDVEGVVLLSTSETKLVQRLTEVLKKYGGEIPEILKYIPE